MMTNLVDYGAVAARAVKISRYPLAMFSDCLLCGKRTDSMSLHRMDPEPQHKPDCPLVADIMALGEPRLSLEHYRRENGKLRKAMADLMRNCPRCRAEAKEALAAMVRGEKRAHEPGEGL